MSWLISILVTIGESIGAYLLGWIARMIPSWLSDWRKRVEREKEIEAAKKEYLAVKDDPSKTAEERAKAYEKYINSGS